MANRVADQSPSETAVRPAWLKPKPRVEPGASLPSPVDRVITPRDPIAPRPKRRSVVDWMAGLLAAVVAWWRAQYCGLGLTTSLILHAVVCTGLGMWFFSQPSERGLLMNGTFDEAQDGEDLEVPLDSRLDTSFGNQSNPLEFVASPVGDLDMLATADGLLTGGEGDGDGEDDASASMVKNIRVPESAITKGSFTVWTEPEDPAPKTNYDIVIQVKLPAGTKAYRLSDLSGMVKGSDGWSLKVRFNSKDRRVVKDGIVQVTLKIPGAEKLVRDEIQIRSKLLREEQTIDIEF